MREVKHRWSGWPGAWCLDCGMEDAEEIELAGPPSETRHRFSDLPHTAQPCEGCSDSACKEPNSARHDPYASDMPSALEHRWEKDDAR